MENSHQDSYLNGTTQSVSANVDVTIDENDINNSYNPNTKEQYQEAIEALIEKNAILEHKINLKKGDSQEQAKGYEKKQFHLDTINMMTKYQIVFLKLETSLKKIMANNEWRNELRKRRGFMKFAENAFKNNILTKKTKSLVNAKTERVCNNLIRIAQKRDIRSKYFMKLKLHSE